MALAPIPLVRGPGVVVRGDDIDTDRIIPARFLKVVTFDGLGKHLFEDVRLTEDGRPTGHPLDHPERRGAKVLISGRNFGCGSSREHAPQAIVRAGFQAVIAGSFAEIFFGNSTTLGLVCVALPPEALAALSAAVEADAVSDVVIDVVNSTVSFGEQRYQGSIPEAARNALARGRYDPLAELLSHSDAIARTAQALPYMAGDRA